MLDHHDLVTEINQVEKMTTPERLKHAKKRRSQQLKAFASYEKQLEKEKHKKNKNSQNQRRPHRKKARVKFIQNIMLLEAAARNDVDEVRKLLTSGTSPDVTNEDGLTALHQCCIDDSEEMLKLLLEFGANVNARDSEMWTPLHAAATCCHVHLCKHLIDKGAELLAVNADGNMPYDICDDEVCLDFIETEMAKRGITQEEIDDKRLETERKMLSDLMKLAADHGNLEYRDRNRATPLHVASANGYLEVLEFLLKQHVSMETRDEDGWLPIHAAACWLQPEVIEILVKSGADLDAKTRTGETAFDLAEDPDVKQKILDLKDELETHRASKSKDHVRNRRAINSRGSTHSSSLKQNLNPTPSASIRRTSMRNEKKPLFKKEAKEEAMHFGMSMNNEDDDEVTNMDDDENVPATNIDDVRISIIDDDQEKHQREAPEKHKGQNVNNNNRNNKDSVVKESPRGRDDKPGPQDDSPRNKVVEEQKRKSEVTRNGGHEPEPIHITMGRTDSSTDKTDRYKNESRDSVGKLPPDTVENNSKVAPNPAVSRLQQGEGGAPGQASVKRAGSFAKRSESQKRRSLEHLAVENVTTDEQGNTVRYPTGTQSGTLADLKRHRQEQHKFGTTTEGMVANLFLHSITTDPKKYSSGNTNTSTTQQANNKDNKAHNNGRASSNKPINNNNAPPRGQARQPPTFISDNGQLRKFSAPTSSPVIGEDDKFKNECCVIL